MEISDVACYLITRHTCGEAIEIAKTVQKNRGAEPRRKICRTNDPRAPRNTPLLDNVKKQRSGAIYELGHALG